MRVRIGGLTFRAASPSPPWSRAARGRIMYGPEVQAVGREGGAAQAALARGQHAFEPARRRACPRPPPAGSRGCCAPCGAGRRWPRTRSANRRRAAGCRCAAGLDRRGAWHAAEQAEVVLADQQVAAACMAIAIQRGSSIRRPASSAGSAPATPAAGRRSGARARCCGMEIRSSTGCTIAPRCRRAGKRLVPRTQEKGSRCASVSRVRHPVQRMHAGVGAPAHITHRRSEELRQQASSLVLDGLLPPGWLCQPW